MKICNQIHQIKIDFNITEDIKRYVYAYLITGTSCYLIDSGVSGSEGIIKEYMAGLGRDIEEIKTIFLTHSHPDHMGGAAAIQELSGCQITAGRGERKWMEDVGCQFKERPIPGFYNLLNRSVAIDNLVSDDVVFSLEEGVTINALETPGHSAGSVSYVLQSPGSVVAFIGDVVPAPGDVPIFIEPQQSIDSIKKLIHLPKIQWYCPAWDKAYTAAEFSQSAGEGISIIEKITEAAEQISREYFDRGAEEQVAFVIQRLGVEQAKVNPLFKSSILSCLQMNNRK
ncbi:MAG: MBL fold metallo-hydrolase [Emergencia timonensis]|uniref:MBL fold metallo-hydrolase n=1 Tax=Emergencia timonensis TaxID=1776384 RepID=UPI00082955F7|nr:MBL fold metallo-hydrolase [Emergencia timonensis]WNX86730.1 MBL fold metallo-hydrolase [Emergencia timonensis]